MRKSTDRNQHYRQIPSRNAELRATFQQQMADFTRGQLLEDLRKKKHLSQADAAYEIGVSEKSVRAWEKGGKIRWHNAKKLGEFYDVDPERLVSRDEIDEDEPTPDLSAILNGNTPDPQQQLDRIEDMLARILKALGLEDETVDPSIAFARAFQAAAKSGGSRSRPGAKRSATG